jgi:RNA polymerase sigma factor (sigma-70 family)
VNIETELLKQISRGDKIAFKELYALFSNKVYATALHYLQNMPDAEEVTQDVFLSIFNNAHTFKGNSSVSTWIYRISVNASLNFLKSRKRRTLLFFDDYKKEMPDFNHPGIIEENKENAKLMYKAIDTLPDAQKTAFILGFIEEKPRQEIADIMEISLKAVESLLQRAKANLKIKLESLNPNRRNL